MRKRTHQFDFYLSPKEKAELQRKAAEAGLNCSEFIRRKVMSAEVKKAPEADVPLLIRDVRRVGFKLENLLKTANTTHVLDAPELRRVLAETYLVCERIKNIYTEEEKEKEN